MPSNVACGSLRAKEDATSFSSMNLFRPKLSLLAAFGLSLGVHVLLLLLPTGAFDWMVQLWEVSAEISSQRKEREETAEFVFRLEPKSMPTLFVDAHPSQATEEKPEQTPYYAVIDAVAGDNSPQDSMPQPEIDGSQDKVRKTMDTPPSAAVAVALPAENGRQAAKPQKPATSNETLDSSKSSESLLLGDDGQLAEKEKGNAESEIHRGESERQPREFAQSRPSIPSRIGSELSEGKPMEPRDSKPADTEFAKQERPRTLDQARRQNAGLIGPKMKQKGGMDRFRLQSTPDLLKTPFGNYDAAVIQAIQQRWYHLLENHSIFQNTRGKVVLKFWMKSDGSVSDLKVIENSAGDDMQSYACEAAVRDPAPYGRWTEDMRRVIQSDRREIRFTFYYN